VHPLQEFEGEIGDVWHSPYLTDKGLTANYPVVSPSQWSLS
jgi:hypothetical protein